MESHVGNEPVGVSPCQLAGVDKVSFAVWSNATGVEIQRHFCQTICDKVVSDFLSLLSCHRFHLWEKGGHTIPKQTMKYLLSLLAVSSLPLSADLIGSEQFNYPDGSIEARAGGVGWNYDRSTEFDNNGVEPGADSDASDWDVTFGDAVISGNTLVTNSSGAKREYNGPSEGADPASEERDGAFRGTGVIYYRVDMTRSANATWSGISGFDFGGERLFFGVTTANAGLDIVSVEESGIGGTAGTKVLTDGQTYTLVAKIDFDSDRVSVWVDPDLGQPEANNLPEATRTYTGTNWNTAVRCASEGEVTWDNLAVATGWFDLDFLDDDNDGMPNGYEARFGLNPLLDDAADDLDGDTISNFDEYQRGTFPNDRDTDDDGLDDHVESGGGVWVSASQTGTDPLNPDSDNDALLDGVEDNTGIFNGAGNTGTNPNVVDSDSDGAGDGTEVLCGSSPVNPGSLPDSGNLDFVGADYIYYANGPLAGKNGGSGFDYDNDLAGNSFTGHSCVSSAWSGSATVSGGKVLTTNGNAFRALAGTAVGDGNFSINEAVSNRQVIYAKFDMLRRNGADFGGLSFFDGTANEIFFFGVSTSSGTPNFAIVDQEVAPGTNYLGATPMPANFGEAYTVVGKIEYDPAAQADGIELSLFVNPDLSQGEPVPTIVQLVTPASVFNTNTIRLGSGGDGAVEWGGVVLATSWDALATAPADLDSDGMPDEWELNNGLVVGINDATGNGDGDDLTNLEEFLAGTNPQTADTDSDNLSDSDEVNIYGSDPNVADYDQDGIQDDEEVVAGVDGFITDPYLANTDQDGASDPDEIAYGSDPTDPNDRFGGDWLLVGCDDFSGYDGAITFGAGGFGFDFDTSPDNGSFVGHTGTVADWNDEGAGGAFVANGVLTTRNNGASREFNGPTEGAAAGQDERYGAVNEDWFSNAVYIRVQMTRRAGATNSTFGTDDFGNFRHAFGVFDTGSGPQWGISIDGGAAATVDSTINDDTPYTLVAKLDYPGDLMTLWVNPDLSDLEGNNVPVQTVTYTNTNWASAVQLGSEGTGDTEWDNLAVAREWSALNKAFTPNPGEGGVMITDSSFNVAANQASLTWSSVPGATYRIERSSDLRDWSNAQTGIASNGNSTTASITLLGAPPVKLFYRVVQE